MKSHCKKDTWHSDYGFLVYFSLQNFIRFNYRAMKKFFINLILLSVTVFTSQAQNVKNTDNGIARPKLVVGIVVDQMRWDYLYRYYSKYSDNGFKRLLNEGYSCENTMINYLPAYTGVGHSTIYTGSVPSIHGIAGNSWYDVKSEKSVYCTDDSTVKAVGTSGKAGRMSPRNLLTTTITDELRMATNFQSKVVGVSLKDRASILPAGHDANAAFWLDDSTGKFITSSYYMQVLPGWVNDFNNARFIEKFIKQEWTPLLPIEQYTESTPDNEPWEDNLSGAEKPIFPYNLKKAYELNHSSFRRTPFGNTLTLNFAEAAINGYKLGQGNATDFLTVNCASTDYAGHLTGINSIEVEDVYIRLDRDLASFFSYLDKKIGKGNYLVFLTADHGAAHAEGFMKYHKMPTGLVSETDFIDLEKYLDSKFNNSHLLLGVENYQIYFNENRIDSLKLDMGEIKTAAINFIKNFDGIQYVVDQDEIAEASIPAPIKEKMINGYNHIRSGSIIVIPMPGWLPDDQKKGTTHGLWNPYDAHIPLLFMGWKIPHGVTHQEVYMTDIAPTLAALLHIQMPNGCIGKPIVEVVDR